MILVLRPDATPEQIEHILTRIRELGLTPHISRGVKRTIIGAIGDEEILREQPLEAIPGVEKVLPILKPYKLASREFKSENSVIEIDGITIGGKRITIIAGPCSVETEEVLLATALAVKSAGATMLRGGAFKPRTSPYSFQGLGEAGLKMLAKVKQETGLGIVTEVMDTRDVELVAQYADIIQIGARNMQNFNLLKEVGMLQKPVLLKRGMMSTYEETLMSAEYIMSKGNYNVILCERGIRTFEKMTRNTLDLNAVVAFKQQSHLPVIVDPSHGTGHWRWVAPLSRAAIAAGADGLMIEVHPEPEKAWSDGSQSLLPEKFATLMHELQQIAQIIGREL
ncbi:MAG: 3-deoxy-7-phosphoheptulonate synthase [bacterium]|nr:3-deoxy-7-phosphoheptulonate synthase [bacterium]